MNLLLDTNVLLNLIKDPHGLLLSEVVNPHNKMIFVSVVSIAELKSIILQNNWGAKRSLAIENILRQVSIIEVSESLINTYVEIDAYSQRRNPRNVDYPFSTPRNMGKNDLWIASTAALMGLKLVTSDADFNHLHNTFIELQYISSELLRRKL
jgi:tRNA(fMet)-specific endonuclease VapC